MPYNPRRKRPTPQPAGPAGEVLARYDGRCEVCGQAIVKGVSMVVLDQFRQWVHLACRP